MKYAIRCALMIFLVGSFNATTFGQRTASQVVLDTSEYAAYCAKQNCFNSSDGPLYYRDEGKGEVLVFVHGVPTSGWLFRKQMMHFMQQGFRVIVPDMLGFGSSYAPKGQAIYEPKQHSKRLLELLTALEIEKCTFITHDAGSLWIADLLEKQPDRAKRLVFINPLLNAAALTRKSIPSQGLFDAQLFSFLEKWTKSSFSKKIVNKGTWWNHVSEMALDGYASGLSADRMSGLLAHYAYLKQDEFQNFNYPSVQQPLLLLTGIQSSITDPVAQFAALDWPPARSLDQQKTIDGGDLLPEQFPELVTRYLMEFIVDR